MFRPVHMGMRQTFRPLWFPIVFYTSGCKDDEMRLLEGGWAVMWKQTSIPEWNPFIIHQKYKKGPLASRFECIFFKGHCSMKSQPIWEPNASFWYRRLMHTHWFPSEMFSHIRFLNACPQRANGLSGKSKRLGYFDECCFFPCWELLPASIKHVKKMCQIKKGEEIWENTLC